MKPTSILIAATLIPLAVAAQAQLRPLPRERAIDITGTPLQSILRERREITDIPAEWVRFGSPSGGWSLREVKKTAGTGRPRALRVKYGRTYTFNPCESWYDRIDLAPVRAKGFRLVGYSAEPVANPGLDQQRPLEAIAVRSRVDPDQYTSDLTAADQIRIRPPVAGRILTGPPGPTGSTICRSEYELKITLEGPKGRDPLAR